LTIGRGFADCGGQERSTVESVDFWLVLPRGDCRSGHAFACGIQDGFVVGVPARSPWGLIGVTIIGAFQLRQDSRLSEEGFLSLMQATLRQFPLLRRQTGKPAVPSADNEGK
jgi:hypothetical protein